ncbi:hypothetical protein GCK32_006592 [Trichostrongylus colubriformis]|uniref:Uncharacterized protein n=1 Tax=Trichostrongylus colubriformis TaxID=6319 RepID=A0AAN8FX47_TRICO
MPSKWNHHSHEGSTDIKQNHDCPVEGTRCRLYGYNTTGEIIYDNMTGSCEKDYGPMITKFDNEKSTSAIRFGAVVCQCNSSSICATQPETFEKLKAVTKDFGQRRAAELVANWLRTGAILIKGKDTLPEFHTTTTTPTTTTEAVTTSVKYVTDTTRISTIALKAEKSQDTEEKCPSCESQGLPLIGLGILCLILIAVIIVLVMKIRGMQHEKKAGPEGGAGTTPKGPKSSGSSEVKSASTGIKSAGSSTTDKTVGSKESGSTEKAGPKSVTGGEQIRSKQ